MSASFSVECSLRRSRSKEEARRSRLSGNGRKELHLCQWRSHLESLPLGKTKEAAKKQSIHRQDKGREIFLLYVRRVK